MNHMYVTPALDDKVIVKDAAHKSREFGPYIVHYHAADAACGSSRHRFFVDGEER
jgi:hypothetical protein